MADPVGKGKKRRKRKRGDDSDEPVSASDPSADDAYDGGEEESGDVEAMSNGDEESNDAGSGEGGSDDGEEPAAKRQKTQEEELAQAAARAEQKARKKARRATKKNANILSESKALWEKIRSCDDKAKRHTLVGKLVEVIEGKMEEIVMKHDASRVVQAVVKYGTAEHRAVVHDELASSVLSLSKGHYSRYLVAKMLKYATRRQRNALLSHFEGHVSRLIKHREAADIMDQVYVTYSNSERKAMWTQELYGPEFKLFKVREARSAADVIAAHPEKEAGILRNLQQLLVKTMDKRTANFSIVHRGMKEYLEIADEGRRREFIERFRDDIAGILHTKDGLLTALEMVTAGSARDRKSMVKALRGLVPQVAVDEFGHMLLMRIMDVVDDTVLVGKVICRGLADDLTTVALNKYGSRVLFHLLAPRNASYVPPEVLALLPEPTYGDDGTSKKDAGERFELLREAVAEPLVKLVEKDAGDLLRSPHARFLVLEILAAFPTATAEAVETLGDLVAEPANGRGDDDHPEHVLTHRLANKVIARLIKDCPVEAEDDNESARVARTIARRMGSNIPKWAVSFGSMCVLALLEHPHTADDIAAAFEADGATEALGKSKNKGSRLILARLNADD